MKPKWLIEHFDDKNSTRALIAEAERQGYEVLTMNPSRRALSTP